MVNSIQSSSLSTVVPQMPPKNKCGNISFTSRDNSSGVPEKHKKESLLYRYRDIIGMVLGVFAGDFVWNTLIKNKTAKMGGFGKNVLWVLINSVFGLACGIIASTIGHKKPSSGNE